MKSIMQTDKECYICRSTLNQCNTRNLHEHHIFEGTANRRISTRCGFTVWLCYPHHNGSSVSVHLDPNKKYETLLKKACQQKYEESGHTRDEFIKLIGRNYLD